MKKIWIILIIVFALGMALPWLHYFSQRPSEISKQEPKQNQAPSLSAPNQTAEAINGDLVSPEAASKRPIAVMVENFPEARPQSGLAYADLVYEAPTEGGITRFLAVFQTNLAKNIGPVRSARVYFAQFANELAAVYAHVGGNSDALANIKAGKYPSTSDADQFFNDPYFKRVTFRKMPHNVYTSVESLEKLITAHGFNNKASYSTWQFKADSPAASSTASVINVDFSLKEYLVKWQYNFTENSYKRFLAGSPHKDLDTGKQITAKNVIVQFVQTSPSKTDTLFSINIDLDSGGSAMVFLDGQAKQATWKKFNGRIRYFDSNNNEILFNRGVTWVELVPQEKQANLTWN